MSSSRILNLSKGRVLFNVRHEFGSLLCRTLDTCVDEIRKVQSAPIFQRWVTAAKDSGRIGSLRTALKDPLEELQVKPAACKLIEADRMRAYSSLSWPSPPLLASMV
jgi:hypothetical protein